MANFNLIVAILKFKYNLQNTYKKITLAFFKFASKLILTFIFLIDSSSIFVIEISFVPDASYKMLT